jgi:hypothetical protein
MADGERARCPAAKSQGISSIVFCISIQLLPAERGYEEANRPRNERYTTASSSYSRKDEESKLLELFRGERAV